MKESFKFEAVKAQLTGANGKNSGYVKKDTEFRLTGSFRVQEGWTDRNGKVQNTDRTYAFFEGTRNGKEVEAGVSANVFLRRPFNGFIEEAQKSLPDFQKKLNECFDAEELFDVLTSEGAFNKVIKCVDVIFNVERPYGQDVERKVGYSVFDLV